MIGNLSSSFSLGSIFGWFYSSASIKVATGRKSEGAGLLDLTFSPPQEVEGIAHSKIYLPTSKPVGDLKKLSFSLTRTPSASVRTKSYPKRTRSFPAGSLVGR